MRYYKEHHDHHAIGDYVQPPVARFSHGEAKIYIHVLDK